MKIVFQFLSLLFFTHLSFAQSNLQIDTIELNSMRIPLKTHQTGKQITVMGQAEIQSLGANSIDELLQTVSGVELQSRGGFGVQGDILMRGSTFTQVIILIDGMKMNDPLTGHFNSYIPVTIAQIDRIEILRGASSAIYGADAVGGVINIITKAFSKANETEVVQSSLSLGSNQLVDMEGGFYKKSNKLSVTGGVHFAESKGELIEGNDQVEAYNTFFDINTIGLGAKYKFSDQWSLSARSSFDSRHFNARYYYTTSTFDKSVETVKNYWNQISISKIGDRQSTDFNFAHKYSTDKFVFSPDFPSTNEHTMQFSNFQVNHNRSLNDQLFLNGGIQVDRRSIDSNDRGVHEDDHFGLYLNANYVLNDKLNFITSVRLDQDANYGTAISPQLNVSYQLNKLAFRGSIGKSIRAADYTERFVSTNLLDLTPGRSLGNPDLLAEESWSYELGIDARLTSKLFLQTTLFTRESSQLIDYVATNSNDILNNANLAPGEVYFFASNISDVTTQGVELSLMNEFKVSERFNVKSSLGYTYVDSSNEEEVLSVYISSHAKHIANGYLRILNPRFTLNLNGLYKVRNARFAENIGQNLNEDYALFNVGFTHLLVENLDMSINVYNLFDTEYQNVLGAPMPGRWVTYGVKVTL